MRKSKVAAIGYGLPEAVVVDRQTLQPILVIEAKALIGDLDKAVHEVTEIYGRACIDAEYNPLAVAVAGTTEDDFAVRVLEWNGKQWVHATYEGNPIGWIPNRVDSDRLWSPSATPELRPSVPGPDVLAARADEINRLLRESNVSDPLRPAVVGACMLALWKSKGNLRKDPEHILADINGACEKSFWNSHKPELARSLHVDEANEKLAVKAREHQLSRSEMVKLVKTRLVGFDDEPVTAALCVANMILRGDGSSSVQRGDAFTATDYPLGSASVVLMNPPYPHKKTDTPTEMFVERGLEGLSQGGRLAAIIPQSLLVKRASQNGA